MSDEFTSSVSPERLLGGELVRAAESLLAGLESAPLGAADRLHLAAVQTLLGLYWELRHQRPGDRSADAAGDPVTWLSALLASSPPTFGPLSAEAA